VLDWADAAVVVSGTATLEAVSRGCPHVALFRASPLLWNTLGRAIIRTRTFTLPNLLAEHLELPRAQDGGRIVPELVPHFGGHEPIVRALEPLLKDDATRSAQREDFAAIAHAFVDTDFQEVAADILLRVLKA
jgi:lipid-A-disaccharide synthase